MTSIAAGSAVRADGSSARRRAPSRPESRRLELTIRGSTTSVEREEHGAEDDERGRGEPADDLPPVGRLPEPDRAPAGRQHDRRLTEWRDGRQRGDGEGNEDQQVGRKRDEPADRGPLRAKGGVRIGEGDVDGSADAGGCQPGPSDDAAAPDRDVAPEEDRARGPDETGVDPRFRAANTNPVDRRVGRDRDAGQQREAGRSPTLSSGRSEVLPWSLQDQQPGEEAPDADGPDWPEPLAEESRADRDGEQRRRPPGERVDHREVAAPVRGREEREVERLERARDDRQGERLRRNRRPADREPGDQRGRTENGGGGRHPDPRGAEWIARGLEQDVPRDVK